MNLQIFGTKKCQNSRKAEMFFKERNVKYQYINLVEKAPSKGELESIAKAVGMDNLIDKEGKAFQKRNLKYMAYDAMTLLLESPELLKTPIVRNGKLATLGYLPDIWKEWLKEA